MMAEVADLYRELLVAWNREDAAAYAGLFTDDGYVVGFDGSEMNGREEIKRGLAAIFSDHKTGRYVGKIKAERTVSSDVTIIRAIAGLVPAGQTDLNPDLNAIQTLVAIREDPNWRISQFQNTPAQFHGRPEAAAALTEELRALV